MMKNIFVFLLLITALILFSNLGNLLIQNINLPLWPNNKLSNMAIIAIFLLYIALMTVPFIPGIEIGLVLMFVLKGEGILLVYMGTIIAMILSFLIGKYLSTKCLIIIFRTLHLQKSLELMQNLSNIEPKKRIDFILLHVKGKFLPKFIKHRYILIATLLNTPGNSLIGGAGGIGLIAGMSGLFNIYYYILVMALAISPIPLLLSFGIINL